MSRLLRKCFEGMLHHLIFLLEEGWPKLIIYMFHLVPHTLMCTCCSELRAMMQLLALLLSLLVLLSHLWCCQSNRLDNNEGAAAGGTHPHCSSSCARLSVDKSTKNPQGQIKTCVFALIGGISKCVFVLLKRKRNWRVCVCTGSGKKLASACVNVRNFKTSKFSFVVQRGVKKTQKLKHS